MAHRARLCITALCTAVLGVLPVTAPAATGAVPFTATIVVADTALRLGETTTVTITFSEAVSGFDNSDLNVTNGTLDAVVSSNNITWIATFTPTPNITDAANVITLDNTGVKDSAGNDGAGPIHSNSYAIDTVRPTVASDITLSDTSLKAGETATVTITFTEAVTGLTSRDLIVTNGTLTGVFSSDGGITWTATFTPTGGVTDATNVITLDNTGVTDLAGNDGAGTTASHNYAIDTVRPTAASSIALADTNLTAGETTTVTITFTEAVTGLDNADLTVANGTLSAVSSSDGGITWTTTFTPNVGVSDATNVITLNNTGVANSAGNAGTGTTASNNYAIDTMPTPVDLEPPSSRATGPALTNTRTWEITYAAEDASGITQVDLYARTPGQSSYTLVATDTTTQDGRFTYTATTDGDYAFHTIATDAAGNTETTPTTPDHTTTLDTQPATSQASGPQHANTPTWPITYTAQDTSGITQVDLYARTPGQSSYTLVATDTTTQDGRFTYTATTDGDYAFHTIATDAAGNTETTPTTPDHTTTLDTQPATSQASGPQHANTPTWPITYTAQDASGITQVDLYARTPGQSSYTLVATDTTTQDGRFTYTATTDGDYAFHTITTDAAGNTETTPTTPDHTTTLDTRAAQVAAPIRVKPVRLDLSDRGAVALRFRIDEASTVSLRIVRDGVTVRSFAPRLRAAGLVTQTWRGRDDRGRKVAPGRYRVVLVAKDAAGNRSTYRTAVRVVR